MDPEVRSHETSSQTTSMPSQPCLHRKDALPLERRVELIAAHARPALRWSNFFKDYESRPGRDHVLIRMRTEFETFKEHLRDLVKCATKAEAW